MFSLRRLAVAAVFVAPLAAARPAIAAPNSTSTVVNACYDRRNGLVRIVDSRNDCRRDEQFVSWNVEGPTGPAGPAGPAGKTGAAGGGGGARGAGAGGGGR